MLDFNWTFVWTIVNILLLYWILKKVLFKPVTEFMENRANSVKEMVVSAEENKKLAEKMRLELEEQLNNAIKESQQIVEESRIKATRQYEDILLNAKQDAKQVAEKMRADIEVERLTMLKELKKQVSDIAIAAATKVVQKNVDTDANKKIIDEFINKVGAA